MEGQAPPPLNGVAPYPLTAADEPHPPRRAVEDVLVSGTDSQAPPLDAVMLEPPAVAEELPVDVMEEDVLTVSADESHPPTTRAAEDVLLSGTDSQAPPLVAVMPPTVAEELPVDVVEEDDLANASSEASEDGTSVMLTDELRDQIVKQVEYYFSDENLPTDEFMLKFVKKNKQGFVPIGVIASFRRMKKLCQVHAIIAAALRASSKLVVSPDGKRVRRLRPLLYPKLKDAKKRTVIVENLPPDFSMESLQEQFGTVGKIVSVTINDPCSVKESSKPKNVEFSLRKVHALVEYEAVEAAEKAVSTLNDASNWRTGLKVSLMTKRIVPSSGKYNQFSKENQELPSIWLDLNQPAKKEQNTTSEKNSTADPEGSTNEEVLTVEDELQQQMANAKGGRKGRYRGQGKGQIQQNDKGQGDSGSEPSNKPIPGPRMPDGTRGFALGRGRPLPLQSSQKIEE